MKVKIPTFRLKLYPSSIDERPKEMKHVPSALMANGYLKQFIIDGGKPKGSPQQWSATAPDAMNNLCRLPYIKGITDLIKRISSNYDIEVALKPYQTIGSLFPKPPKDSVPKYQTRGAIYSIP